MKKITNLVIALAFATGLLFSSSYSAYTQAVLCETGRGTGTTLEASPEACKERKKKEDTQAVLAVIGALVVVGFAVSLLIPDSDSSFTDDTDKDNKSIWQNFEFFAEPDSRSNGSHIDTGIMYNWKF